MASPELQTVLDLLRRAPILRGDSVLEMRAAMQQMTGALPRPSGVAFELVETPDWRAEWAQAEGADPQRTLLYFHGGGYCMGSIDSHRGLVAQLSRSARARVLSVDYRLGPEHPHPAAIEDAVAAWRHALERGAEPRRSALAGDSAGGGLVVATLVALREAGLPLPAAGVCISPWTDLTLSGETIRTHAERDPMVSERDLRMMAQAYLAGGDAAVASASPLFADLAALPPLLVQVGGQEILLDDARRLAERANAAGVDTTLEVWDEMFHVWHSFGAILPEGLRATERIGEYLDAHWR